MHLLGFIIRIYHGHLNDTVVWLLVIYSVIHPSLFDFTFDAVNSKWK